MRFAFEFKIGSDKNTILGYRFDDKPGHDSVASRVLTGETAILIDNPVAVAEFLNEMTGSQKLYLRIRSLTLGRTTGRVSARGVSRGRSGGIRRMSGNARADEETHLLGRADGSRFPAPSACRRGRLLL